MDILTPDKTTDNRLQWLDDIKNRLLAKGVDGVDLLYGESIEQSRTERMREPEDQIRSESAVLGVRVIMGKRQAAAACADLSDAAIDATLERATSMVRLVPEDPYCGLAVPADIATHPPIDLESYDPAEPGTTFFRDALRTMEETALGVKGVVNSEGATAGWDRSRFFRLLSNGFSRVVDHSSFTLSVAVLASDDKSQEFDYSYSSKVFLSDLEGAEAIGLEAGERAVRRLGARKVPSGKVPVIFQPRIANTLVGHLASAVNGDTVAAGQSFLGDRMGQAIFPKNLSIVDDPLMKRMGASTDTDCEGLACHRLNLIDNGDLRHWLLNLSSAKQLGLTSNGRAGRGASSMPRPGSTNVYLTAGQPSPEELIRRIDQGFYVTHLMGSGVNLVTGDYSRGASGFWIDNGEITYPVSEVTIASNLLDMFRNLEAANDLEFRYSTNAPTIKIAEMTLAGS